MKQVSIYAFVLGSFFVLPRDGAGKSHHAVVSHADSTGGMEGGEAPSNTARFGPKKNKKKIGNRRRCNSKVSPDYRRRVRIWTRVPRIRGPRYREGYRDLAIFSLGQGVRIRVFPFLPNGQPDPSVLPELRGQFRDNETGREHSIHPRLIKLLYKLADHFEAKQITIVSGYRANKTQGSESRHAQGRAVDLLLPGIAVQDLARKARTLGRVGVGVYPNANFVHLDVRKKHSVFWVDRSGPGQKQCYRRILKKSARKFDRRWKPKDDEPVPRRDRHGNLFGELSGKKKREKKRRKKRNEGRKKGRQMPKQKKRGKTGKGRALSGRQEKPEKKTDDGLVFYDRAQLSQVTEGWLPCIIPLYEHQNSNGRLCCGCSACLRRDGIHQSDHQI